MKALIQKGADVNSKDGYGTTILSYGVASGCADVVKVLIEAHVNVNSKGDKYGFTPLFDCMHSSMNELDMSDIMKMLTEAGADVNSKNE